MKTDYTYSDSGLTISTNRLVFNEKRFDNEFMIDDRMTGGKSIFKNRIVKFLKEYHPKNILNLFTILNLISEYKFKKYLVGDVISGLTSNKKMNKKIIT